MPIPTYGAASLAKTFLAVRALQALSFIIIIAITANFVSEVISANQTPSHQILGTLTVTSLTALYTLISVPFFWAPANIGLLVMAAIDFLCLVAFVVVSIALGKPISYLNCWSIRSDASPDGAAAFTQSISANMDKQGNYVGWAGATRASCLEAKGVWAVSIALCVLYATSSMLLPALFAKQRRALKGTGKGGA